MAQATVTRITLRLKKFKAKPRVESIPCSPSRVPEPLIRRVLLPLTNRLPDPRSGHQWAQRAKRFVGSLGAPFDDRYFDLLAQHSGETRQRLLTSEMLECIEIQAPRELYHRHVAEVSGADPLNRALYADLRLYLPGDLLTLTDRISMAHSLEVRVPFLDHELLEFAARIPTKYKLAGMDKKRVLKRAVADLLPPDFLKRRKMGLGGIGQW